MPVGGNLPCHSCTEHAPLKPFRWSQFLCERMRAMDWAREGFSATIITLFMIVTVKFKICKTNKF